MEEPKKEELSVAPEKRERKQRSTLSIPVPAFLKNLGDDVRWYYDVRLWLPVILLLLILSMCSGGQPDAAPAETEPSVPVTEAVIETEPTEAPIIPEAEALAILAESVGAGRSNNVKTVIMWIAVNRSEAQGREGYGKSLIEEIERSDQWQGYDENAAYSQEVYDIALEVLETVENGGLRPIEGDMLWLVLNNDNSVTIRNQFLNNGNQSWHERRIK